MPVDFIDETFGPRELDRLLPLSDFLVVTCPLTAETRGLFGASALAQLPSGAAVLNLSRAGVMDYSALSEALRLGHLSGAILDVFDPEPLPSDSPLWDTPNLMISPHVSSNDAAGYIDRCLSIFAENLCRLEKGEPLSNMVDGVRRY